MAEAERRLTDVGERQRAEAMRRYEILRPHLEDGERLTATAAVAKVPLRTAQRWLSDYRSGGLVGLAPKRRSDLGSRWMEPILVVLIEGLALRRPKPAATWGHRQVCGVARSEGWSEPSYRVICQIISDLDPALATLAHDGDRAYQEAFDLLHRHQASRPNALWQADHTQLDLILDTGERPWLTIVLDDHSRAVAGYSLNLDAPSALNTSLALRHAIWAKPEPTWEVHGIPDVLYVDHGSDFISLHLEQVAADLHIQLIHSAVGQPRGRGKIERFFRTVNQLFTSTQPGYTINGRPTSAPLLTLTELDERLRRFLIEDYNQRQHRETGQSPRQRWSEAEFLPRTPGSIEDLDLLLATVAKSRVVHRDGIRFAAHRYLDTTLAGYIGEAVTIRYDPRDIAEIRVFHDNSFICRAIFPELSDQVISLNDVIKARRQRKRQLRAELDRRHELVDQYLDIHQPPRPPGKPRKVELAPTTLRRYHND